MTEHMTSDFDRGTSGLKIKQPIQLTTSRKGPKLVKRESMIEKAIKLRKGGWSDLAIARELDVGKTTVRKWMWDARVP